MRSMLRHSALLASLLVADPDLLVLDEPTNHLDVEGVAWLAAYLSGRRPQPGNALVVVTHDRWFLDAVSTLTWEVSDGEVHVYEGGYAAYVLAKVEHSLHLVRESAGGVLAPGDLRRADAPALQQFGVEAVAVGGRGPGRVVAASADQLAKRAVLADSARRI